MTFDHLAPLPRQPLLLEASAGTGKTWTIASLTARYIAEDGVGIEHVLLITFTDKAARELRSRVFERLIRSERDLTAWLDDGLKPEDPVSSLLCLTDARTRRDRLRRALADFDRATVSTIHSFCRAMLKELGVLGDWDVAEDVLTTPQTIIDQCATDVYLARYEHTDEVPFPPKEAIQVARAACESPLPLSPVGGEAAAFADEVRARFATRKRALGVVTFDDMPGRLQQVLASRETGSSATSALADRFRLVMVDEFQDTDPIQWDLVRRAFMGPGRTTILIGDPKQSIYGFRNADLGSYLDAARQAERQTLDTNYRSDAAMVEAVAELFGNVEMGDSSISVAAVKASHASRFTMPGGGQRILIRRAEEKALRESTPNAVAHDLTAVTQRLLLEAGIEERPLRPADIAVLVRSGGMGRRLVDELLSAGIPATFGGSDDILDSRAAQDWRDLLRAMAEPRRSTVVMAACTDLIGFEFTDLVDESGEASERAFLLVRRLAQGFGGGGIPAVLTMIASATSLHARVLSLTDGERRLADLLHVAELLAGVEAQNLQRLLDWMAGSHTEAGQAPEDTPGRLASDSEAVRVMTIHAAKGLEFGVVLLPEVSNLTTFPGQPFPYLYRGTRWLHVGGKLDHRDPTRIEFERQARDEELRLLYVGLTRARHLAVAWHIEGRKSGRGPLTALLARDRTVPGLAASYNRVPASPGLDPALIRITDFETPLAMPAPRPGPPGPPLSVSTFSRTIDQTWRRTSYSGLTFGLHEGASRSVSDEPETDLVPGQSAPGRTPSPMAALGAGTRFGTLVHAALEHLDWSPSNLEASAIAVTTELAPRHGLTVPETELLARALVATCTTPLGSIAEGRALTDFPLAHRLSELDFDLPLADAGAPRTLADLARLMAVHLTPDDPLAGYPRHLSDSASAPQTLNGFLTGSIDAVLRTESGRFLVVDYKTNRFRTGPAEELTVEQYSPAAMTQAMIDAHYPLQALLYCVALHRYLSWRLPGYVVSRHLGGVGYLFVRGMAGVNTPVIDRSTCGVFSWFPPVELVVAASDLLAGKP